MRSDRATEKWIELRRGLGSADPTPVKPEMEGGCGVVGLASDERVAGKHIMQALVQMHNRGNSKGGGVAAFGLDARQLGVSREILDNDYLLQIAFLDSSVRKQVEEEFIFANLKVHAFYELAHLEDFRRVKGLDVEPPEVWRYFCRVKDNCLDGFAPTDNGDSFDRGKLEDEFIYQNTYRLNEKFYKSLGDKKAFVLSHGRNMIILKIVGYAEQVIEYYRMEDLKAHIWIGHQRYPTKGRVWHPGGAHPFIGMDEALVHNGDFANYSSLTEYLGQRNIRPLFLTDTEVSVLLFDLFNRTYQYSLESIIEALAPTTERDFEMLPEAKKKIYRAIQAAHIHSSPDGPWFFIIGRTDVTARAFQLLGITDTSMLRPQVFALQENGVNIGLIASEKQAIDATLRSLHGEDPRYLPVADVYWNARGGSYTDGGAFIFSIREGKLTVTDKFGKRVTSDKEANRPTVEPSISSSSGMSGRGAFEALTRAIDRRWRIPIGDRARIFANAERALGENLSAIPDRESEDHPHLFVDRKTAGCLAPPADERDRLVIDCEDFASEGPDSASRFIVDAYRKGWKNFVTFDWRGQRFCGCGLGPGSDGVRIDVFGNSGDYLASGLDGARIFVHENAQDQVAQIMKRGRLVIYGDVGQTFMYGAKGGEAFVLGNAAGRPLINAVGCPRVVINGTCLDYLAESFMAGDPLNGGGFVILNGLRFDARGEIGDLEIPYPGGNLFSLASGGAIYVRDPHRRIEDGQLNGGKFVDVTEKDWDVIRPYLEENERLFDLAVERLLTVDGERRSFDGVYRKVEAVQLKVLAKTEY